MGGLHTETNLLKLIGGWLSGSGWIICEKYAKDHMIKFNPDKCTLLVFSDPNFSEKDISISISGCEIRNVKNEKKLRTYFSKCRKYD